MAKSLAHPIAFEGPSEMAARLRAGEGEILAIGDPADWPAELRLALSLCLNSNIPTAIYWGEDLRLVYNDAWAPIAGEKHPWAIGRRASEVWDDIWNVIEPQLSDVVATGRGFNVEDQMLPMRRGGRVQRTHWDYSFTPIFDADTGEVLGIFNQGNETTARLAAERALRASEQRLEYALGASESVGTWDWDVPNDRVTSDARFARLYGISPELAAAGAPVADFMRCIHPEDKEGAGAAIDFAMRTGQRLTTEYRLVMDDGEIRWVTAQGRCTMASDGTPLRFPGVSFDITGRKAAESALRESEERFRAITDSIDQMIWSTRPDGYHDYYNQRWYDFTGMPPGSTDGDGWNDIFHPDDQARAWDVWNRSLATGAPYHIEYRLRHHSGVYRWVLGRAQAVRDDSGAITRWFGTCTDIQDIVDAREVLARSRAELEQEVAQRTADLMRAEERLRQSEKMEAMGQLSGGIAHDFNNMLAVVLGSLSLLERRCAKGEADLERYIEAAKDGATRAANLTQRLLAFSRKQPLEPTIVSVGELIGGMVEMLSRTLGEKVNVLASIESSWTVHADVSQLENAILNLAVNARDAMPSGGDLEIAVRDLPIGSSDEVEGLSTGDYVEILVSDAGAGMDSETVSRAFDPFFTTKEVGRGTGLGLSQVFGFVQQSNGRVKIESEPGNGTQVRIFLPRDRGAPAERATPAVRRAFDGPRGCRVLVVEDDHRVRAFSTEALRDLGYEVFEARTGEEALLRLGEISGITVLFSDIVMPGIGGRQLAAVARESMPGIKVLLTTGYERDDGDRSSVGATDEQVLRKPYDVDQLAEAMDRLLA